MSGPVGLSGGLLCLSVIGSVLQWSQNSRRSFMADDSPGCVWSTLRGFSKINYVEFSPSKAFRTYM